jgi:hypothetical protein
MLSVVILNIVMLNAVMLSVAVPNRLPSYGINYGRNKFYGTGLWNNYSHAINRSIEGQTFVNLANMSKTNAIEL